MILLPDGENWYLNFKEQLVEFLELELKKVKLNLDKYKEVTSNELYNKIWSKTFIKLCKEDEEYEIVEDSLIKEEMNNQSKRDDLFVMANMSQYNINKILRLVDEDNEVQDLLSTFIRIIEENTVNKKTYHPLLCTTMVQKLECLRKGGKDVYNIIDQEIEVELIKFNIKSQDLICSKLLLSKTMFYAFKDFRAVITDMLINHDIKLYSIDNQEVLDVGFSRTKNKIYLIIEFNAQK